MEGTDLKEGGEPLPQDTQSHRSGSRASASQGGLGAPFDAETLVLRRADPDDCDAVINLVEIGEDDIYNRVYAYPKILKLIETAYLAISVVDRDSGAIVAFAAFEDYPPVSAVAGRCAPNCADSYSSLGPTRPAGRQALQLLGGLVRAGLRRGRVQCFQLALAQLLHRGQRDRSRPPAPRLQASAAHGLHLAAGPERRALPCP